MSLESMRVVVTSGDGLVLMRKASNGYLSIPTVIVSDEKDLWAAADDFTELVGIQDALVYGELAISTDSGEITVIDVYSEQSVKSHPDYSWLGLGEASAELEDGSIDTQVLLRISESAE